LEAISGMYSTFVFIWRVYEEEVSRQAAADMEYAKHDTIIQNMILIQLM
jgi:hypothetical protein